MVKAIWEEYKVIISIVIGIIAIFLIGVLSYNTTSGASATQSNTAETYMNNVIDQLESVTPAP